MSLPAVGRQGPEPGWPLDPGPGDREAMVWGQMWRWPQAVMWESQGQHVEVALYVRLLCEAERRDATGTVRNQRRQMADDLGLTLPGMQRHRWRIAEAPPELAAGTGAEPATAGPARGAGPRARARDRFGVVAAGE